MSPLRFTSAFVRPLGLALGGVLLIGVVRGCGTEPPSDPYAAAIIAAHTRKMAADAQALREADSALAKADGTTTTTVVRYRTLRDTVNLHDTVQVVQLVERADSVVRACTELQDSCQRFRVRADSVIAGLTTENTALRAAIPTPPGKIRRVFLQMKGPALFLAGVWIGSKAVR